MWNAPQYLRKERQYGAMAADHQTSQNSRSLTLKTTYMKTTNGQYNILCATTMATTLHKLSYKGLQLRCAMDHTKLT